MVDRSYVQHLTLGGELLRSDRVEEARTELLRASALKPGDAKILSLLGLAYFRLGEYPDALRIYADLAERQPDDASLRLNLGLVHLKMGAVDQSVEELLRALDLAPNQPRTMGYLGLAYARRGEYPKARQAFLLAGQTDLAREMEPHIRPEEAEPRVDSTLPATASEPALPDMPAVPDVAEEFAEGSVPDASLDPDSGEPVLDRAEGDMDDLLPARESSLGQTGRILAAVRAARAVSIDTGAQPGGPATPEGHQGPTPVSLFATAHLIRPDDGDATFELAPSRTLIVRIRGRVLSRTDGVIVSGGELAYEPAFRRIRGRVTEEAFGADASAMYTVSGHGHMVVVSEASIFTALTLSDDILYVREDLVFAFEEHLHWENGHVPGSVGALSVVQFRGEGAVALRSPRAPLTIKLAAEQRLLVDSVLLAGWVGRVVPRVVPSHPSDEAASLFVECSGEGVVLALEPLSP